jgi:hypothetical protein
MMIATDHALHLSFTRGESGVTARGTTKARAGARPAISELSATIVTALSDTYELELCDDELRFFVSRGHLGARTP